MCLTQNLSQLNFACKARWYGFAFQARYRWLRGTSHASTNASHRSTTARLSMTPSGMVWFFWNLSLGTLTACHWIHIRKAGPACAYLEWIHLTIEVWNLQISPKVFVLKPPWVLQFAVTLIYKHEMGIPIHYVRLKSAHSRPSQDYFHDFRVSLTKRLFDATVRVTLRHPRLRTYPATQTRW